MRQIAICLVVFSCLLTTAWADTITVTASANGTGSDGVPDSASDSSTTGTASARADIRDGFARSTISTSGAGAVTASGLFGGSPNSLGAVATYERVIMNTSGSAQDFFFDFTISPALLRIYDNAGVNEFSSQQNRMSFAIDISFAGLSLFDAAATMRGGSKGHVLEETGTDLGGVFSIVTPTAARDRDWLEAQYRFGGFTGTLDLGTLAAGSSATLLYTMSATLSTLTGETGGAASIGDPFDLSGTPGLSGEIRSEPAGGPSPDPIPEPGTLLLCLAGLGAGVVWRRRAR